MNTLIDRAIKDNFIRKLVPNKVLVLLGARRVGKSLFIKQLIDNAIQEPYLLFYGEDMNTIAAFSNRSVENYRQILGSHKLLIIDEAQKIPQIGSILKLIVDQIDGIKIIVTGSSVFDLTNKLGEPLTGRKFTYYIYPLAQMELSKYENVVETKARLESRLIFGNYPELLKYDNRNDKASYLNELTSSYLLKDILELDGLRNSSKMLNILRMIALQIGKEVSLDEIGKALGLSRNTVERYLDLLTKVFVVHKVQGFSRNLRNEIVKNSKWYFYDNGIRNALIANFNPLNLRNDDGELWENYLISERIKYQEYTGIYPANYFWRTYQQQEIDWVEERDGKLFAYEFKWNPRKKVRAPLTWSRAYPDSTFNVITPDDYLKWIQ
jgi:uncharacterized protein